MDDRVTRTAGRYEILEELGRGGMATVYLARQTGLRRLVALKELSAFRQADPSFTQRFLRESRLAGSLSHPNIVTVHDYFEFEGTPYIAMEYVERGSLRPHVGHMSLSQIAGVLEGMLSALDYAGRHDVVHRDLKPENVMITADGRVKIADFGIAKATGVAQTTGFLTATGMTVGTPNYIAPEQAMGRDVGPWTDLYSLGMMTFEFFVGHAPFADTEEPMAILMHQVSDPIPPARSVNPDVDERISAWIEQLVVKDPSQRARSATEAWDQFEEIVMDMVGPRWRRSAPLLDPSERPLDSPAGPETPPPTHAAQPPLMPTTAPDQPPPHPEEWDEAAYADTVMPEWARRHEEEERQPPRRERPRPERRRRERRPWFAGGRSPWSVLVVAGLLLFAVLALASALKGGGSGPDRATEAAIRQLTSPVASPDLGVRVPRDWSRLRRAPDLGLPLSNAAAAAPRGSPDGPVVEFGMAKGDTAANSALLPDEFVGSTGQSTGTAPPRSAVGLPEQNLQAWRYRNLRRIGDPRALTVFTVPTTAGVATVACATPPGQTGTIDRLCDAIAGTLRLGDATPFPIGPSDAYANALNGAMGGLQQVNRSAQGTIASATTLAEQAAAEQELASAYDKAAAQLAGLSLSPADRQANDQLVTALRGTARAYRTAASAATAGDAAAYRAASAAIPSAREQVNSTLAGLRAAGYKPVSQGASAPVGSVPGTSAPSGGAPSSGDQSAPSQQPPSDVGDSRSDDPSDDSAEP